VIELTDEQRVHDTQLRLEGHRPCPTCAGSRPRRCCNCGGSLTTEGELSADPYELACNNDPMPHLQCDVCYLESQMNIRGHIGRSGRCGYA